MKAIGNGKDYEGNRHSPSQWAYLAGIIDGEGCIRVSNTTKDRKVRSLSLIITNTDVRLIEWLRERFNGSAYSRGKGCWNVEWHSRRAKPILLNTLPFLIIKEEQAELGIAFIRLMGRKSSVEGKNRKPRVSPDRLAKRLAIQEALSILKHRVKNKL